MSSHNPILPHLLPLRDAAQAYGLALSTLRRHIREGHGPVITRIGRRQFVTPDDLSLWIAAHRQEGGRHE